MTALADQPPLVSHEGETHPTFAMISVFGCGARVVFGPLGPGRDIVDVGNGILLSFDTCGRLAAITISRSELLPIGLRAILRLLRKRTSS